MRDRRLALIAALLLGLAGLAPAQSSTSAGSPKPAANAWMLTPTPYLEWNKDISPSVRAERDRYQNKGVVGQRYPLTAPHPDPLGPGIGDGFPKSDIRNFPQRVILTATFVDHRSVLSASEFSLYSEVAIQVDQVFEDQAVSGATPGGRIIILLSGGTVVLRSGRTLSYGTAPIKFCLQPQHKYLLMLSYHNAGSFYLAMNGWDISDGLSGPQWP